MAGGCFYLKQVNTLIDSCTSGTVLTDEGTVHGPSSKNVGIVTAEIEAVYRLKESARTDTSFKVLQSFW